VIPDNFHHERALWGIGFPIGAPPFDQTIIHVVEKYLESRRNAVLDTGVQGLDIATIMLAVVVELDRELIEHKIGFFLRLLYNKSCQKFALSQDSNQRIWGKAIPVILR
jgi:hypothetical protein